MTDRPFKIGDRVVVLGGPEDGERGTVVRVGRVTPDSPGCEVRLDRTGKLDQIHDGDLKPLDIVSRIGEIQP